MKRYVCSRREASIVSRACASVLCSVLFAGCLMSAVRQTPKPAGITLVTPQSISPGSIHPPPMVHTAILPASVMLAATVRTPKGAISGLNYTQLPGAATAAAAAPDGSLWVLSTGPSGPDKYIWHYSGGSWTNISGLASAISVAPNGTLYAINSGGSAYAYSGGVWTGFGGGCRALTAAYDNSLYVISNGGGSDGPIWHYAGGTWTQQPGAGVSLTASWDPNPYSNPGGTITPDGLWVINSLGLIYYLGSSGYVQLPGAASAIAPITGGLFVLGYPTNPNGNALYYYDLANPDWTAQGGSGLSISSNGQTLYIEGVSGAIYSSAIAAASFNPVPSWWSGDCDSGNHPGSYRLGGVVAGVPACGPRPILGAADFPVQFFPGSTYINEWECVELSMRYMYLAYGIPPYLADGWSVVQN